MRNAFAEEITKLADADPRVVLLSGDIGNRLFDAFKGRHPDRFYNCGVAEANMIGMAAGLAMSGLRPVVYTIAPFLTTRCLEQIRVDICCHDVGVVLVGVGAGLAYASLGPTHHSCEDVALLRALPNMTVLAPGDPVEARLALRETVRLGRPAYLRIGKKGEPIVHKNALEFEVGRAITVHEGGDVCLLSTGAMLPEVLGAAGRLALKGVNARVASFHTIKPLDTDYLRQVFKTYALVATIEEHTLIGGFGAAVAEWLADGPARRARLCRFGTPDLFHHEAGDQEYARRRFGLTAEQIADRILRRLRSVERKSVMERTPRGRP